MMGDGQPAAVDLFVDVGHHPIDFTRAAVFHLGQPALGTDFPGPHLFHRRPVIDHHHGVMEGLARGSHPIDVSWLGQGAVRREREQEREER